MIAQKAHVSRALVHYHYASKERLAEEAWTLALNRIRGEIVEAESSRPGLAKLARSFAVHFDKDDPYAVPARFWLEYWAQASRVEELRQVRLAGTANNERARVKELLTEIKSDSIRPLNPYLLSKTFAALMLGFEVQLGLNAADQSYEQIRQAAQHALFLLTLPQS